MPTFTLQELTEKVSTVLQHAGASAPMAEATAQALVRAEAQGLASHGLSRVAQYAGHLCHGRVNGLAKARVIRSKAATTLVDAEEGLAFPACALAVQEAIKQASLCGTAFAGVTRSHHFGVAAHHLEPIGAAGMVGLAFGNSPAAMPAWGGRRALFGTNPIAAIFPRHPQRAEAGEPPLVIDLSLSQVARGKLMVAAKKGEAIPPDWALDKDGQPTIDAAAGLAGMMLPAGGVKGAMLAMMVELLCCTLTGAAFGFEADSFFSDEGNRPRIGQAFWVIDPAALAGPEVYGERMETLIAAMLQDPEVRLPGYRRLNLEQQARENGIEVPSALLEQWAQMEKTIGA